MDPYYSDEWVTLYHGDSREWMPSADVLVTDPPWGVGKADWDADFLLPSVPASIVAACLMPGISNLTRCPTQLAHLTYRWTLAARLTNGMTRSAVGFGNWIAGMIYAADGVSAYTQEGDFREFAVGREPMPDHPSPKPLGPMRWFVSRMPPGVVLDPFAGSGTTLVAAKAMGRKSIGVEIEERYCEIAANRCRQETLGFTA